MSVLVCDDERGTYLDVTAEKLEYVPVKMVHISVAAFFVWPERVQIERLAVVIEMDRGGLERE